MPHRIDWAKVLCIVAVPVMLVVVIFSSGRF